MGTKISFPSESYSGREIIKTRNSPQKYDYSAVIRESPNNHDIYKDDWMLVHKNGDEKFDGFVADIIDRGNSIKVYGELKTMTANDLLGLP